MIIKVEIGPTIEVYLLFCDNIELSNNIKFVIKTIKTKKTVYFLFIFGKLKVSENRKEERKLILDRALRNCFLQLVFI